jgi:hypothetical protein
MKVARFTLQILLSIVLPLAVQLLDRRRFTTEERARVWGGASWGSAIYNFGEFSMLGWCWVTRRWAGIPMGIASSFLLFMAIRWAIDDLVARLIGDRSNVRWQGIAQLYAVCLVGFVLLWALTLIIERVRGSGRPGSPAGSARPDSSPRRG